MNGFSLHIEPPSYVRIKAYQSTEYLVGWLVGFVALRPKSTAMVIAGRSVHLTTLFPGQASTSLCPLPTFRLLPKNNNNNTLYISVKYRKRF